MSVLKPVYNIYQLNKYPILNILTFGCRFPCRADNAAYPHDGRADKRRYRHDRRADSQCHLFHALCFDFILDKHSEFIHLCFFLL